MLHDLTGGAVAFALGVGVILLTHGLNRYAVKKGAQTLMLMTVPRQLIHIAFLVALYVLAPHTPWELFPLLLGGALGLTLPMIFLTRSLISQGNNTNGGDDSG